MRYTIHIDCTFASTYTSRLAIRKPAMTTCKTCFYDFTPKHEGQICCSNLCFSLRQELVNLDTTRPENFHKTYTNSNNKKKERYNNDPEYRALVLKKRKEYVENNREKVYKKNAEIRNLPENREKAAERSRIWH